jgi:hypothetical protein
MLSDPPGIQGSSIFSLELYSNSMFVQVSCFVQKLISAAHPQLAEIITPEPLIVSGHANNR